MRSILLVVALVGISQLPGCSQQQPADLVLMGGEVHTVNPKLVDIKAVAIRDKRIVAAGGEGEMAALIGEGTKVVDLHGQHVYPGFTDAHAHLLDIGDRELSLSLDGTESSAALLARLKAAVAMAEPGEWVIGRGWIETHWDPPVFPTRQDLDAVSPDNPVSLERADGHSIVVNSMALALAGIDADTEDPAGGDILRDADGVPTGMLVDNAMDPVLALFPERSIPKAQAYRVGAARSARLGWTQIQDAGVSLSESELQRELAAAGELDVRVYSAVYGPDGDTPTLLELGPFASDDLMFVRRAIKIQVDGALGSRGAALLEPYADADTDGLVRWSEAELLEVYREALRKGIQLQTHAIGDRANRMVLDLYAQAFRDVPASERAVAEPRWRIEHAQLLAPEDLPRFAELGVIPSMQPSHAIGDLHFAPTRLGMERLDGAYAWRELLDSGVVIPAGSDAPVEVGDPRIEFYAAVARQDLEGFSSKGWHPEQAMTREEALKSLTLWPAIAAFQEKDRGSIAIGKLADFTVLDTDLLTAPIEEVPEAKVVMTIVNGRIVHDARH
ncbi:MAG: amidohydrolase [Gammaproteobacteria bacterium]|nr:amidohydrolase [Gammaproteobacteria bacterium]